MFIHITDSIKWQICTRAKFPVWILKKNFIKKRIRSWATCIFETIKKIAHSYFVWSCILLLLSLVLFWTGLQCVGYILVGIFSEYPQCSGSWKQVQQQFKPADHSATKERVLFVSYLCRFIKQTCKTSFTITHWLFFKQMCCW